MNTGIASGGWAIRGWLLLNLLVLIPHGVSSLVMLFLFERPASAGTLGTTILAITGIGNLLGIFLILARARMTPLYFIVYLPGILALNLLNPNLFATVNARLAQIDPTAAIGTIQFTAILAVNVAVMGAMTGYWLMSTQVAAVFGKRGMDFIALATAAAAKYKFAGDRWS